MFKKNVTTKNLSGFLLVSLVFISSIGLTRERDRDFGRGRGGNQRGNERSERPRRVPVGSPTSMGNGCPAGTVRVSFAPDNLSFSILFDQFIAQTDGSADTRRNAMICDTQIPIEIPANMQMEITRVDYRGFVSLPQNAKAKLVASYNFKGRGGDGDRLNLGYKFQGPLTENYTISTDLINGNTSGTEISQCGGQALLRIVNRLQVVSGAQGQAAQVTIDSIDGKSNAIYYVNWRTCSGRSDEPGRNRREDRREDGRANFKD